MQTITTVDARNNFSDLLGEVYYGGKKFLIEKLGKPFAILINIKEYQKLEALRETFFEEIAKNREKNRSIPFSQVKKDIREALDAIRKND